MMPSRFWASTKGSIMPFSCAMRRIQRSERMAILLFCPRGGLRLLDERTGPLNRTPVGLSPKPVDAAARLPAEVLGLLLPGRERANTAHQPLDRRDAQHEDEPGANHATTWTVMAPPFRPWPAPWHVLGSGLAPCAA